MRNCVFFKLLAILLCVASLMGIIGSTAGILVLTENDLYNKTVQDVKSQKMEDHAANFATQAAYRYADQVLGGCPEDISRSRFYNILAQNYAFYGYSILDADGNVVESLNPELRNSAKTYTSSVTGQYMHLVSLQTESQAMEEAARKRLKAYGDVMADIDGETVPPEGISIHHAFFTAQDGSILYEASSDGRTGSSTYYYRDYLLDNGTVDSFVNSYDHMNSRTGFLFYNPHRQLIYSSILEEHEIAKAPTGTGKTFAFGIPMIEHIDPECPDVQGLILAPTRELAIQIGDELRGLLTYYQGIRVAVLYGGAGIGGQIRQLEKKPQIVVATPGRLMDHYNRKTVRLDKIQTVVLDEADRMLDMGFFKDVTRIIEKVKNRKNLGLFSATISQEVMTVSWMYQRDEVEITVEPKLEDRPDIDQYSLTVSALQKAETTLRLIKSQGFERIMIFCNTKHMCQRLCDEFQRAGLDCECIHGDIRQSQREKTMQRYRDGKLAVLIATDVASRGIDVDDVDCVINYDVPEENEYYVHRIGRTGRAKRKGSAYSIIGNFPEKAKLDEIAKFCNFTIKPMLLGEDGMLTEEEIKTPAPPKKRFR